MTDQYNTMLMLWLLLVLIGCWLVAIAIVDLGARYLRRRITGRFMSVEPGSENSNQ